MVNKEIMDAISLVREAEHNIPIAELKLVDSVDFRDGKVLLKYHCVSPFCPSLLVLATGLELKERLLRVEGIKQVEITLKGHYMADDINKRIASATFGRQQSLEALS